MQKGGSGGAGVPLDLNEFFPLNDRSYHRPIGRCKRGGSGGAGAPPDLNPKFPKNVTVTTTPTAGR